jgi:carbon monoxide dehydrogenase subunit G
MSLDFKHTIVVQRPSAEVFDYLSDFSKNPEWQGGMVSCTWTSDPIREVGSTYAQQAQFMGKKIETHFKVVAYEPGKSISIESTKSTFPIQVTRSVRELGGGGTEVTAHIRGQPTGLLKLFSGMVRKSVKKDYARLKNVLEGMA